MNLCLYLPLFSVSSVKTETCLSCSGANFWWNSKLWKMKSEVANRSYADEQSSILRLYVDARNSFILSCLRMKNSLPKQSSLFYDLSLIHIWYLRLRQCSEAFLVIPFLLLLCYLIRNWIFKGIENFKVSDEFLRVRHVLLIQFDTLEFLRAFVCWEGCNLQRLKI